MDIPSFITDTKEDKQDRLILYYQTVPSLFINNQNIEEEIKKYKKDLNQFMNEYNIKKEDYEKILKLWFLYDKLDAQKIISGGWHFSFCLPIEKILEKIRFYSHSERNNEVAVTKEHIENCILNKTDIWNGEYNYAKKSNKLINFSIDKLPKYIRNNIKRFENYLDL